MNADPIERDASSPGGALPSNRVTEQRPAATPEGGTGDKRKKKKDKVRSAWISFAGRIVAQVVGAAATVALGLIVARHVYKPGRDPLASRETPASSAAAAQAAVRPRGAGVSVAVLPLANLSGDAGQDYFADGMTEALITDLAKVRALRVISRTSVLRYKGGSKPLPEIARELGVDAVVEGSVLRAGKRVRVTAQLIDAARDEHLWAESYERDLRDVLTLQDEVSRAIAREVSVALTPLEQTRRAQTPPVDPEALLLYLKGRYAWNRSTIPDLQTAARFFEEAVARDPGYAPAHAGLADTYALLGSSGFSAMPPREAMHRARAAAEKAIALDGTLAAARASLAFVRQHYDWDFPGAESDYRRALDLAPGYATAHQWYATLLAEQGRSGEALAEARRALEYDPVSPVMYGTLAFVHFVGRDFDAAVEAAHRGLAVDPAAPGLGLSLAMARYERGDRAGAIGIYEGLLKDSPSDTVLAQLGNAYARDGQVRRARDVLHRLEAASKERSPAPHLLALLLAGLGDREAALAALGRAIDERSDFVVVARVHPLLDPLRGDPRFAELLTRVGPSGS